MANPSTSIIEIDQDSIIERVTQGERLIDIAKSYGFTSHAVISKHLASNPKYQAARELALEARMDVRESELESADDSVTVARARELLSHARWRAERECPRRWGAKQEISTGFGQSGVTINIQTVSPTQSVVIDQIEDESPTSDNG